MQPIPPATIKTDDIIPIMVELESKGVLKPFIEDYSYWDKVKYKSKANDPQKVWEAIKLYRSLRYSSVTFGNHRFSFMVTDTMQRLLHQFDLHIGGNLGSNIGIAETDKTKFMVNSIMEEAISSSQIEGAITTRKKAKDMIRQEKKPKNKSEQMIMNNFITMKHIVQHKNELLTPQGILFVHQLIATNTLENPADEGQFRDNNEVHVVNNSNGEIVHTPPDFKQIEKLIEELCVFFNDDSEPFIHPIVKGCIVHFMIGWIHPFVDGNGRTARALFYWYMLRQGYWLTEYLTISRIIQDTKSQYEKAYLYTENDDNDLGYFIHYHLNTMAKAFSALKEYISAKQKEVSQAASFMKLAGVNDRMAQILKIIFDDSDRVLSTKELENRFNVSGFTARSDLKALVQMGFLEAVQVNKKKQHFIKSKKFDQLVNKLRK